MPKQAEIRFFEDSWDAWSLADRAARKGWRVISMSWGPAPRAPEPGEQGSFLWHVLLELPLEAHSADLEDFECCNPLKPLSLQDNMGNM